MSDLNHPQNQPEPDPKGRVPLPRDEELEDELQRVKEELDAPKPDKPVAPSDLKDAGQVQLEREVGTVRRERLENQVVEEGVKDLRFRRKIVGTVLCILGLVAIGSLAVIAAGIATGIYPMAVSALVALSGSGGGSVFAWSSFVKATTPAKPEPEPTGEGP